MREIDNLDSFQKEQPISAKYVADQLNQNTSKETKDILSESLMTTPQSVQHRHTSASQPQNMTTKPDYLHLIQGVLKEDSRRITEIQEQRLLDLLADGRYTMKPMQFSQIKILSDFDNINIILDQKTKDEKTK